jgi:hypothetical protein
MVSSNAQQQPAQPASAMNNNTNTVNISNVNTNVTNNMAPPQTQGQLRQWPLAHQVINPATHQIELATDLYGYNEFFDAPVLPTAQAFANPSADVSADEQQRNRRNHAAEIKELHDMLNQKLEFAFGRANQEYAKSVIESMRAYLNQVTDVAWYAATENDMAAFNRGEGGRRARMSELALAHSDGSGRFANPFVQPPPQPQLTALSNRTVPSQAPAQQAQQTTSFVGAQQPSAGPQMLPTSSSTGSLSRLPIPPPAQQGPLMHPTLAPAQPMQKTPTPGRMAAQKKANFHEATKFHKAIGKPKPPQLAGSKHENSIDLTANDDNASAGPTQAVKKPRAKGPKAKPKHPGTPIVAGYDALANTQHQFMRQVQADQQQGGPVNEYPQIAFNASGTQDQTFDPSQMVVHARLKQLDGCIWTPFGKWPVNLGVLDAAIVAQENHKMTFPGTYHKDYNWALGVLSREGLHLETRDQFIEERRYVLGLGTQQAQMQAQFAQSQAQADPLMQAMHAAQQGPAPQASMMALQPGCMVPSASTSMFQDPAYGQDMLDGIFDAPVLGPEPPRFPQSAQTSLPTQMDQTNVYQYGAPSAMLTPFASQQLTWNGLPTSSNHMIPADFNPGVVQESSAPMPAMASQASQIKRNQTNTPMPGLMTVPAAKTPLQRPGPMVDSAQQSQANTPEASASNIPAVPASPPHPFDTPVPEESRYSTSAMPVLQTNVPAMFNASTPNAQLITPTSNHNTPSKGAAQASSQALQAFLTSTNYKVKIHKADGTNKELPTTTIFLDGWAHVRTAGGGGVRCNLEQIMDAWDKNPKESSKCDREKTREWYESVMKKARDEFETKKQGEGKEKP